MSDPKPLRWWLPGPPPPRRLISVDEVEESYRGQNMPEYCFPVRHASWTGSHSKTSLALAPYLNQHAQPSWESYSFFFHGYGNAISPKIIQSFSRRGPSIRFARGQGYFSRQPAVYWSNSIHFAIAWSFFAKTGSWNLSEFEGEQPFQCLVFVSRLNLAEISFDKGLYLVPIPSTADEEEELRSVRNWFTLEVQG